MPWILKLTRTQPAHTRKLSFVSNQMNRRSEQTLFVLVPWSGTSSQVPAVVHLQLVQQWINRQLLFLTTPHSLKKKKKTQHGSVQSTLLAYAIPPAVVNVFDLALFAGCIDQICPNRTRLPLLWVGLAYLSVVPRCQLPAHCHCSCIFPAPVDCIEDFSPRFSSV